MTLALCLLVASMTHNLWRVPLWCVTLRCVTLLTCDCCDVWLLRCVALVMCDSCDVWLLWRALPHDAHHLVHLRLLLRHPLLSQYLLHLLGRGRLGGGGGGGWGGLCGLRIGHYGAGAGWCPACNHETLLSSEHAAASHSHRGWLLLPGKSMRPARVCVAECAGGERKGDDNKHDQWMIHAVASWVTWHVARVQLGICALVGVDSKKF